MHRQRVSASLFGVKGPICHHRYSCAYAQHGRAGATVQANQAQQILRATQAVLRCRHTSSRVQASPSGTATSSDGFEGKNEAQRTRDRRMSRVEELASTEIGFKDSEGLKPFHLAIFVLVLSAGLWFLTVLLYFTADIKLQQASLKVLRRLLKTVALRQVMGILAAMTFVRFGLEPLVKMLRKIFVAPGTWEKSSEYYILKELYSPLEFLFSIAAFTTLAENFLPQLIALPKGLVQNFVRSTLSLTFVIAAARVVFNIKARMTRETTWSLELKGELTKQRRVEAVDKLLTVLTLLVASVFGLQAIGLDVNSVLAIGGVGGLAVGLAGREILENLFTGLIILSSSPFEVGDEVMFAPPTGPSVEGIVVDVGWYRTTIRSFEREIYNIPNSVFSRNVVLNVTRKQREWRFFNFVGIRVQDMPKIPMVIADMRKLIRQDQRIIQRLHRRVFLDKVTRDEITIYISFYVEAANRDAFMSVKQDLLLAFMECIDRNGAYLARNRIQLEWVSSSVPDGLPRQQTAPKIQGERPEGEAGAAPRALPESEEDDPDKPQPSSSGEGSGSSQGNMRERPMGGASSNVVPKESMARAAISIAAAGSMSSEERNSLQQGPWVTASFDDLPDR